MAALPGLLLTGYGLPWMLGLPLFWLHMLGTLAFIAWIILVHEAGKASDERKSELYRSLSEQRQEIDERQHTIDQVRAGEIEQPWSR